MARIVQNSIMLFDDDDDMHYEEPPRSSRTKRLSLKTTSADGDKRTNRTSPPQPTMAGTGNDFFTSTFNDDDEFYEDEDEQMSEDDNAAATTKKQAHRPRVRDAVPAASRPITANPDDIDRELIRLREEGLELSKIAKTLKDKFGVNYESKSTHSRYLRLKAALAAQKDQELELGLDTWHEGEDEALITAYHQANDTIENEYVALKDRRWTYTARALNQLKPKTNYSEKACHARFRALMAGIASIPPELDDDPEKRIEEMATKKIEWIAESERANREKLEAEARAEMAEKQNQTSWHVKQKDAADKAHAKVSGELERVAAQLEKKRQQLARIGELRVKREAKLQSIKNGGKGTRRRGTSKKDKDAQAAADLRKKVTGFNDDDVRGSPAPAKRTRGGAGTTAKVRRAILTKRHKISKETVEDSMDEYEGSNGGASGEDYDPTPGKKGAARRLRAARKGRVDEEAELMDNNVVERRAEDDY